MRAPCWGAFVRRASKRTCSLAQAQCPDVAGGHSSRRPEHSSKKQSSCVPYRPIIAASVGSFDSRQRSYHAVNTAAHWSSRGLLGSAQPHASEQRCTGRKQVSEVFYHRMFPAKTAQCRGRGSWRQWRRSPHTAVAPGSRNRTIRPVRRTGRGRSSGTAFAPRRPFPDPGTACRCARTTLGSCALRRIPECRTTDPPCSRSLGTHSPQWCSGSPACTHARASRRTGLRRPRGSLRRRCTRAAGFGDRLSRCCCWGRSPACTSTRNPATEAQMCISSVRRCTPRRGPCCPLQWMVMLLDERDGSATNREYCHLRHHLQRDPSDELCA